MKLRVYFDINACAAHLETICANIGVTIKTEGDTTKAISWVSQYCHHLLGLEVLGTEDATEIDSDLQIDIFDTICAQPERLMNAYYNMIDLQNLDSGKTHTAGRQNGYISDSNTNLPITNQEVLNWNEYDVIERQNVLLDKSNSICHEIYIDLGNFVEAFYQ